MTNQDYTELWSDISIKRRHLADRRADLESELNDVNNEITHLDEVIAHLRPLAGMSEEQGSIVGMGITDAIRTILRNANTRMSAMDVRRELSEKEFDFRGQTQPMASIYKILARLCQSDEIAKEQEEGRVFYAWKTAEEDAKDEEFPF